METAMRAKGLRLEMATIVRAKGDGRIRTILRTRSKPNGACVSLKNRRARTVEVEQQNAL
jgi:hypothetical protein